MAGKLITERGRRLAPRIDHTLLKADATPTMVAALCEEARMYGFASVCVNPVMVRTAAMELSGSRVRVGTVIGFPLGAATKSTKAFEVREAVDAGAEELDMVLAVGLLKAGETERVADDIAAVVKAGQGRGVKVILETWLLNDEEKRRACRLAVDGGAKFVKTSTGFGGGGATVGDIRLMRQAVGSSFGVKASGGIRSFKDAENMLAAGADRLGTSSGVAMVTT
jgi:deoxyribose-phosphate aldolase